MTKTIFITGSTDGIGLETAKMILQKGHRVLLHGRNPKKLEAVNAELSALGEVAGYIADLSDMNAVIKLAKEISDKNPVLDVLINNAGVLKTPNPITEDGLDIRFAVNTIAPYLLTKHLLPLLSNGRVINLSSAAQAPVNLDALAGKNGALDAMTAYSQSKLAIAMWSHQMAQALGDTGPIIITVNPGSMLGSKMVREGFGVAGHDLAIGANILTRLSLDAEFADKSGHYFDNDSGRFTHPHPDALDAFKISKMTEIIEAIICNGSGKIPI